MRNNDHDHTFGQDRQMPGARRTLVVIAITGTMMIVEIGAGLAFGSMALLADGLHNPPAAQQVRLQIRPATGNWGTSITA